MKLSTQIILRLIIPLVLGMLLLGVTTTVLVYTQSGGWSASVEKVINEHQLDDFAVRPNSRAAITEFVLDGVKIDTNAAALYLRDLLRPGLERVSLPTVTKYLIIWE
ncbi:hypothetical protein HK096_002735 [Nowakowskiella sp. JEL0078]|nr:hypothetical protein HK096_002735 [Nowakowskiella sp. JEL0078]